MTFMLSEFLKFLLLECRKLLEPNGCVTMRMDPDVHNSFSSPKRSQISRLYYRHTYAGFSTVWTCPSLFFQTKHECQTQIHDLPRSTNLISLDFCVH